MSKPPITVALALAEDTDAEIQQLFRQSLPELLAESEGLEILAAQRYKTPGLVMHISNQRQLKSPLNLLNAFAKRNKCDFVVCIVNDDPQGLEEICFFGHNEGKPDLFEISCYLNG